MNEAHWTMGRANCHCPDCEDLKAWEAQMRPLTPQQQAEEMQRVARYHMEQARHHRQQAGMYYQMAEKAYAKLPREEAERAAEREAEQRTRARPAPRREAEGAQQ